MDRSAAHQLLGLAPGASPDEVRGAYRRLVMACHPDRAPGDPEAADRFRAVHAAYLELSRPCAPSAPFVPLTGAGHALRVMTLRIPLSHAIRGSRASIGMPDGRRLGVQVPAACGVGVVLSAADGSAVKVEHILPARMRSDGADLRITVPVDTAGRAAFLGADDRPVELRLGDDPPARIVMSGWGAPRARRTGARGDLIIELEPSSGRAGRPANRPAAGRVVDALV